MGRSIEIDSCAPAHFDLSVLPIYVARVPAAPFTRSYPRHFTLITRTAPCLRQLPSCVAVYPRDSDRDVFYVAELLSSIRTTVAV